MRHPHRLLIMLRYIKVLCWGFVLVSGALIALKSARPSDAVHEAPLPVPTTSSAGWFPRVKPFCNALEVVTKLRSDPPPAGPEGQGYGAACYALAGRIDAARAIIERLPPAERSAAAGIIFDVGHPVADLGDDKSAGPIMELVVAYWPNHYMALYHAGASEFQLGQYDRARVNLQAFLKVYEPKDGWVTSAQGMLERIAAGAARRSVDKDSSA